MPARGGLPGRQARRAGRAGAVLPLALLAALLAAAARQRGRLAWVSASPAAARGTADPLGGAAEAAAGAGAEAPLRRRLALALGPTALAGGATAAGAEVQELMRLDEYGRILLPSGALVSSTGKSYEGAVLFRGKPKVFVAGSTGELGRRVVLDLLRAGYSVYSAFRDNSRAREVQYETRRSEFYEQTVVPDCVVGGERAERLREQLADASVVIHVAGARKGFDVFRPFLLTDEAEPERTDRNGTKALVDAAVAKGVKKFIYVSAILTNARALGEDESSAFKDWNSYGNVLDMKHEAEEYLKASGLDYTIIRPTPMNNDFPRDVGGIWFGAPDTLLLKGDEVGKSISRDDVSLACVDAIYNEKASNGTFELTGAYGRPPTPRSSWWSPSPSGKKAFAAVA